MKIFTSQPWAGGDGTATVRTPYRTARHVGQPLAHPGSDSQVCHLRVKARVQRGDIAEIITLAGYRAAVDQAALIR